jgi:aspartyl-tRNA(Asn)/glutamyl-tRNA(Gln) amidotransferase subunit B
MGLATNCNIDSEIYFDRKHYFYPDFPKGYQISQYKRPICSNGSVTLPNGFVVELERIHQEEDVAKSTHHGSTSEEEYTLIDYNKSGVPLIEIVTKPCIRNAKDAKDFATQIRQIARYLNISDADMEKGQMRCEPNISIQEKGRWEYKDGKILAVEDYKFNTK